MTLDEASLLLSSWLTEKPAEVAAQKAALDHYGKFFHPDNLGNITQEDFRAFLAFKNNRHWANIQRQPNIYADMGRLRKALSVLLDEGQPIQGRLDKITDKSGPLYIKGLSRAVLTPILMCVYPGEYAVYNRISEEGLKILGRNTAKANDSFGKRYVAINDACHQIAGEINHPLWLVDSMFSLIIHGPGSVLFFPATLDTKTRGDGNSEIDPTSYALVKIGKPTTIGNQPPNSIQIDAVRKIVDAKRQDPFFKRRYAKNVASPPQEFSREEFWKWMVVCLCTTVQPSGPTSRVSTFVREKPFPLALAVCESKANLQSYAKAIISNRGLRRGPTIATQIETNIAWLRDGGWKTVQVQFTKLAGFPTPSSATDRTATERAAARSIMSKFGGLAGFGPKQARNLWQCLGVTQYEIPLDSRVTDWLNALPSGFGIEASKLYASVPYYEAKMTEIQALCAAAGVLPCEFDAAVFSNADDEPWPENDTVS